MRSEEIERGFDAWWDSHEPIEPEPSLYEIAKVAWVAAPRAALARERELREALRELVAETEEIQEGFCQILEDEWASTVDRSDGPALTKAKALLAQLAAGEEREQ